MTFPRYDDIILRTKRGLYSLLSGEHDSPFSGEGLEFLEIREYQSGDDVRHLNWRATARTRRPAVNRYAERRRLEVLLVYAAHGGMLAGEPLCKHATAAEILTSLAYLAAASGDAPRLLCHRDDDPRWFTPSASRFAARQIYETLRTLPLASHRSSPDKLTKELLSRLKRRSLILILDDGFALPELSPLAERHEIYYLRLRARQEERPPASEAFYLDPASGERARLRLGTGALKRYRERLRAHDTLLEEELHRLHIPLGRFYAGEDPHRELRRIFKNG